MSGSFTRRGDARDQIGEGERGKRSFSHVDVLKVAYGDDRRMRERMTMRAFSNSSFGKHGESSGECRLIRIR